MGLLGRNLVCRCRHDSGPSPTSFCKLSWRFVTEGIFSLLLCIPLQSMGSHFCLSPGSFAALLVQLSVTIGVIPLVLPAEEIRCLFDDI